MRMIKFRAKRVNGGEWVKSMTISYGTIKRKMYNVFFEVEPNKTCCTNTHAGQHEYRKPANQCL